LISFLYSLDVGLFRWVNEGWSHPLLDHFFSFITEYKNFLVLLIPWLIYLLIKGGPKGRLLAAGLFFALLIADQTSSHLLKLLIQRARPCNALEGVLTPHGKSSAYSFPSSHAANMGAAMFLLSMAYRRWTWMFVLTAFLVGLSRVYLGLHYPSDVLGGYALGLLAGFLVWRGTRIIETRYGTRWDSARESREEEQPHA
jgi:undecaprenyl-diphosphatase